MFWPELELVEMRACVVEPQKTILTVREQPSRVARWFYNEPSILQYRGRPGAWYGLPDHAVCDGPRCYALDALYRAELKRRAAPR